MMSIIILYRQFIEVRLPGHKPPHNLLSSLAQGRKKNDCYSGRIFYFTLNIKTELATLGSYFWPRKTHNLFSDVLEAENCCILYNRIMGGFEISPNSTCGRKNMRLDSRKSLD